MSATERTYLTRPNEPPHYVEFAGLLRTRRNKIRQFQCCVCAFIIVLFVMTLVITTSYSINHSGTSNFTTENLTVLNFLENRLKSTGLESNSDSLNSDSLDSNSGSLTNGETIDGIQAGNEAIKNRRISDSFTKPLPSPSPDSRHQFAVSTSLQAGELALAAVGEIAATTKIEKSRFLLGKPSSMGSYFDGGWAPQGSCKEFNKIICNPSKYRTFDGTCNNPNQWGSALSPYLRILPPAYADGINSPRASISGKQLPSAREVSLKVHPPSPSSNPSFTVMLAVFGQFLDHDMTATAISQGMNGNSLSCCSSATEHPECFPVKVGHGDPVYDVGGISCMEFVRSAPAPQCKIGPRQQLNQVTAFIDGSTIYGSDFPTANSLREFEGGRLRMQLTPDNRTLLPRSTKYNDGCNRLLESKRGRYCFAAGDGRANENLHLTTMHVLWARQHNKLAEKLSKINPSWDDETLYQEARRIVGAQLQHIAYTEFIPIVLGETTTDLRNLKPLKTGFRKANTTVNPELGNNFAAAAFRFAHTLLPGLMRVADSEKGTTNYVELHRMLFNPYSLYSQGGVSKSVTMATSNVIQKTSTHVTSQLTSHLFEDPASNKTVPCGLDLVSLNVQRGRDHGLPGYTKWREHCGLKKLNKFSDLKDDMDPEALDAISKLYFSVDDVDLYTGALAEISKSDGIIGPTFTCLIGEQFQRSQQGDTFWYENSDQPGSFTAEQITELRMTSLAKLICDCSDGITQIQSQVMRTEKFNNPIISCEDIPGPSLEGWREVPTLTDEEPDLKQSTKDWLAFKNDINETIQNIVEFIKVNQVQTPNSDYIYFQKEINESFGNLRNELLGLHPQSLLLPLNNLTSLNSPKFPYKIMTFINDSLQEASNQISLIARKPAIFYDWMNFKTNIIKSFNDSITNSEESSPTPAEWFAFEHKLKLQIINLKNQVADIKDQLSVKKRNSTMQEVVNNEDIDWEDFRAEIIESVNEIVDMIKGNMPPPGDPNWEAFAQNVKDQFTNFKNGFITPDLVTSSGKHSMNSSGIIGVHQDQEDNIRRKFSDMDGISSLEKEATIDETPEWIKFKEDLNETVEKILQDIKDNSPPYGDPSWSVYEMKIMDQFSRFKNDIPMKSRVLLKISENGAVFDWMTFKSDWKKSLDQLIADKKAGKLFPGDPNWAEFRNKFKNSIAGCEYRIPVMNLSSEGNSDWMSFRRDLTEAIKNVVVYIKENAPPPGSPDWCEFRKNIREKFAELRKEFDLRKSGLLLKASTNKVTKKGRKINNDSLVNDTSIDETNIDDFENNHMRNNDTKINEVTSDWVSLKAELNKTLEDSFARRRFRNCLSDCQKWVEFKNYINKSISTLRQKIVNPRVEPQGQQLLLLTNDWIDFSNQINKSLAEAFEHSNFNNQQKKNPALAILRDTLEDNFAKVKKDIEDIRAEWLSEIEKDPDRLPIPKFGNNESESFYAAVNKSFSNFENHVKNVEMEFIPFNITLDDWMSFKNSINETVINYIDSINRSVSKEWMKFKDFVDQSVTDIRNQIITLKNVTDQAVKIIDEKKKALEDSIKEDDTLLVSKMNETINDIERNLSTSESTVTNTNLENIVEALMYTRDKVKGLSQHHSHHDSKSAEDWKPFLEDMKKNASEIGEEVTYIEKNKVDSKWDEYRHFVKGKFKELDNAVKDRKMNLLKMTSSASSSKFLYRCYWIGSFSIVALTRILRC